MITEVRNEFTDDQNYTHIDVWENDAEEGQTVAIVCRDTRKVFFIDNLFRGDSGVNEAIQEVLREVDWTMTRGGQRSGRSTIPTIDKIDVGF